MKLGLNLKTSLTQTLTPQQIQYLKLLQLPVLQLEQHLQQEIESNPMLEEESDIEFTYEEPNFETRKDSSESELQNKEAGEYDESYNFSDAPEPFEFHQLLWEGVSTPEKNNNYSDDDEEPEFQIKNHISGVEDLMSQIRLLNISEEEILLAEHIIGNIDGDGYLRRDLQEIVDETNDHIAELNFKTEELINDTISNNGKSNNDSYNNPAKEFSLSADNKKKLYTKEKPGTTTLDEIYGNLVFDDEEESEEDDMVLNSKLSENAKDLFEPLREVDLESAEAILYEIRHLDPAGIGSRTVQECLVTQCELFSEWNEEKRVALEILKNYYDMFAKKHYDAIKKNLDIDDDILRRSLGVITTLNPKPGGYDYQNEVNSVIPDFRIEKIDDIDELMISLNDDRLPSLKLSTAYEKIKKDAKFRQYNKETKEWIRKKYDDAKFLMQAIRQRKQTMLKVMTAIAGLQREFFDIGEPGLRPLIYKDVAEMTGLDISTVCRIVNGKYVSTDFGTFELKYFFSESLPTVDGDEISTTVIKKILKDIIDSEDKNKPISDEKLSKLMKEKGYNIARRTVAKYREQLKIPVARLRKELV